MKKTFSKESIRNILLSVIASVIFVRLVEPAMDILGNIGNRIVGIVVDYYYHCCANATSTDFINIVAYIVLFLIVSFCCVIFSSVAFSPGKMSRTEDREGVDLTHQDLETEIQESEISMTRAQKRGQIRANLNLLIIVLVFLIIVTFVLSPVFAKNNFDNKIIKITPYIDSVELARLNADWVSMKTRDDYLALKEKVQDIMATNGIE